jgi:RNA recognition motif-containing protein
LPFKTTDEELRDFFSSIGTVENASVVRDRDTGRSRGFGFVEMGSQAEAQDAISALNGRDVGGRQINVSEARERTGGGGGGGGGFGGGGGRGGRGGDGGYQGGGRRRF